MAKSLQITSINEFGDFKVVLDGCEIPDVVAYTLQEGYFDRQHREFTNRLVLEILFDPTGGIEVQR